MRIYFWMVRLAALFGHRKAQLMVKGQAEVWDRLQAIGREGEKAIGREGEEARRREGEKAIDKPWIWFHVSSVGEFEQARPVLERLKAEQAPYKVLLTFFSPSGYEMRKDYDQVDMVTYLPFATRANAKRFISMVQPKMAIFVKYEFWPAYLKTLKKQGIATYNIAAIFRPTQLFFKPWGGWYRNLLNCFTTLFVQDEASKELLDQYHVTTPTIVAGDTRFDRVSRIAKQSKSIEQVKLFREYEDPLEMLPRPKMTIVAGSTWPQDEALLARYIQERDDVKLVLVPHEIHEQHLHGIFTLFQGQLIRFTRAKRNNIGQTRVLLLDTMGMLSSVYQYADAAYIGGGFGDGIHNTLEAAVWGVPVLFGPKYHKFREAIGLIQAGASFSVKNYEEFKAKMDEALANHQAMGKKAKAYVESELGATDIIYESLKLKVES